MNKPSFFSKFMGKTLLNLKPLLDSADENSVIPFQDDAIIRPRLNEKYYSWTHYGIFIPNLPEPHRYLNIMIFLGTPSALAFDHDQLIAKKKSPRRTATFFSSTAATQDSFLKAYDFDDECQITENGDFIQLGDDLTISGKLPDIHVKGKYLGINFDFKLDVTRHVSWFLKNPIYDHLSLLSKITGTLFDSQHSYEINDLCTYEYARSVGIHSLYRELVPRQHKIPLDFFTYQIINIDSNTQILLTKADILGKAAAYTVHVRYLGQPAEVYTEVDFNVLNYSDYPQISPLGEMMKIPKQFQWIARDKNKEIINIIAECDAPFQYGHGRGYATSYRYQGTLKSDPIKGLGYMEYVNLQK
jgi:hypothetical protein